MAIKLNKNAVRFTLLASRIRQEISNMSEISDLVERFLRRQYKILVDRSEDKADHLSKEEKLVLAEWYDYDIIQLRGVFSRILRYSLFTTIMSVVESNLVALCYARHSIMGLTKEFKKPGRNVIGEALKYLKEQAKIDFSRPSYYCKDIDMFRRIRHCIVHSQGKNTDKNRKEIEDYCTNVPTLSINRHGQILLGDGFIKVAIHIVDLFFDSLIESSRKALEPQLPGQK